MEIKELYHYMVNATEEQNDQAIEVLSDIMSEIKKKYPDYYRKYDKRLEEIYNYNPLTKEEAIHYVNKMTNKDGTVGAHWTYDQTTNYLNTHLSFAGIDPNCFYVAMNMMYSDYYQPARTIDTYATLAKDFIQDKDAPADKVKRYMEAMH